MRIAVCIKQVPASNEVAVDPETHTLIREKTGTTMNPSDFNALEMALEIKEKLGEEEPCEIIAITMGPSSAEEELRTAIAMGVDEGCLLTDRCFAGGDTIATARTLAKGIEALGGVDLVIAGAESSDGATGQVGPMLAEAMGIPQAILVQRIESVKKDEIEVVKKFRQASVRLKMRLPAVITTVYGSNEPRLTTLRSRMAAKKKELKIFTNGELKLDKNTVGLSGSPTVVTDSFQPEQTSTSHFLSGDGHEIAVQILELVEKERGNG